MPKYPGFKKYVFSSKPNTILMTFPRINTSPHKHVYAHMRSYAHKASYAQKVYATIYVNSIL